MLISLKTLLTNLSSILHSRTALQLENLALRHQIGVLQRSSRKRPKLTLVDRLLWVWLSRIWSGWRSALAIVRPETVVAWHRKGSPLRTTGCLKSQSPPGRELPPLGVLKSVSGLCSLAHACIVEFHSLDSDSAVIC